jgi:predicted DsbA family dithiol-disulfide isomerase
MPIEEYLNRKYGPGMASRANGALAAAGNECGIKFVFEGRMVCDTLKSHLLVDYARQFGKEDAMVKMLFKYYFEAINNVNNVDVLVKAAEEVGLNGEDVRRYLDSGDGKEHVMKEVKEYTQRFRISGVPFFIVSKKVRALQVPTYPRVRCN